MNRFEAWALHLSTIIVGGTGLVYGWMRYFARSNDPFSLVNHPWQPSLQHLHIWTAPLLVFAAGLIWRSHVWEHWKRRLPQGRRTGITLMLTLAPMTLSGFLIQTTVSEGWRKTWIGIHLATAVLWMASHAIHAGGKFWRKRKGSIADPARARGPAPAGLARVRSAAAKASVPTAAAPR